MRKFAIIFLPISLNMCLGFSKKPFHRDGSFEYPQHMFCLRNKKTNCQLRTLISWFTRECCMCVPKRAKWSWIAHLSFVINVSDGSRTRPMWPRWGHFVPQINSLNKFKRVHWVMLHTKYQDSLPCGFREWYVLCFHCWRRTKDTQWSQSLKGIQHTRIQNVLSEGVQLRQRFFLVFEWRDDSSTITSGPSSARKRNAI